MEALASMNANATVFYRSLIERLTTIAAAADAAHVHAENARRVAEDMREVAAAAQRVEALVERLDDYTKALESRLRTRPTLRNS
jgi:hypothetical protein